MTVREVLELKEYQNGCNVIIAMSDYGFFTMTAHDAVNEKYLDRKVKEIEYLTEEGREPKDNSLWIELEV